MDDKLSPELIILGSMALDDIETPFGKEKELLGGSATYAGYSASFFAKPGLVSIVGKDFPAKYTKLLTKRDIDLNGVQIGEKTFRWQGFYGYDLNSAKTLCTELNSLEAFKPSLPEEYKSAKYVFLGNTHPGQQMDVIRELKNPEVLAIDTMNLWIEHTLDALLDVVKKARIFILNEGEARQLFKTVNLVQAGKKALHLGPEYVIIKKGEHGAIMFSRNSHFNAPAYPLEMVKDPTGCGDCFGGGLIGYIAEQGELNDAIMRKAIVYGSVCASFNAENFSLNRLLDIKREDIDARFEEFREIRQF